MISIDGGTGSVIVGAVPLVPPAIDENFGTILGWADDVRRLRVRANADTPEDAAKAREFGAEGIGLPDGAHVHVRRPAPVVREMILAREEEGARALDRLLPLQQADFEGIFEAMAGLPVTIRLLDPPLHEFLPPLEEATSDAMRDRIRQLHEANPMLGTRAAASGSSSPRSTRCRCARSCGRRARSRSVRARRRSSRSCTRSSASARSRTTSRAHRAGRGRATVAYLRHDDRASARCDPRRRDRRGGGLLLLRTNDLTQTALGFSRDDAEGKFLTFYLEHGILERNPFEVLDEDGVGDLMRLAVERGGT